MVIRLIKKVFLIGVFLSWSAGSLLAAEPKEFVSASSWEEVQQRQRLLPTDDIWWTVTGKQMAWMHKNVHQLFPTVNVYRSGQVSELQLFLSWHINLLAGLGSKTHYHLASLGLTNGYLT